MKREAPVSLAELVVAIGWQIGGPGCARRGVGLPSLGHGRKTAVRRVDDPRRSPVRDDLGTEIKPPDPGMAVGAGRVALERFLDRSLCLGDVAVDGPLLKGGSLFLRQILPIAEVRGPLHRRDAAVVKDAAEVWVAPGRPSRGPLWRLRGRRDWRQYDCDRDGHDNELLLQIVHTKLYLCVGMSSDVVSRRCRAPVRARG